MNALLFKLQMAASVAAAGPSSSPVGGDMSSPGPRPQPLLHQQDFYLGLSNRSNGDSHVIVRGGGDHVGSDDDEDDDEDEGPISATARAENGNGSDTAGATSVDRSGTKTFAIWGCPKLKMDQICRFS